ncbi:shikimate dehydrogenase [Alkalihalobacillus sp. LMS6]|uniref:shikimate dehydrogenase n=1 Tax=Alkalihalobacillus sp. LMS6 TaxID=2924034 RepID=UPI0020D16BAC|nr:shikimate dehydrogenase [Alkalihalobacillus sp. LMS6]UTR07904.1 shikimate dehydrogenase [Alkalihalobacillus sp. LMS6]
MKKFALIGKPLGHSKSASIHQAAYEQMDIQASYQSLETAEDQVKEIIDRIRADEISGLNVTIPHKVAVMAFLDEIDEDAEAIGAVNTIKKVGDRVIGYNTDAEGFKESLLDKLKTTSVKQKKILVIGAGGAARAIVHVLAKGGALLSLTNRTHQKAETLAAMSPFDVNVITKADAEKMLEQFDIVINTTSVGMSLAKQELPLQLTFLHRETLVCDLIYNPLETVLLKEARLKGNKTLNGVGMLVNQAALAIELWTGEKPNRAIMEKTLLIEAKG